jgi:hypothetical protein
MRDLSLVREICEVMAAPLLLNKHCHVLGCLCILIDTCLCCCAECSSVNLVCKYMKEGVVTNVTGAIPCTLGASWNFTGSVVPTVDGQVACHIPGNPVATQKLVFPDGNLQQCAAQGVNVTVSSSPTENQCLHVVQLAAAAPGKPA